MAKNNYNEKEKNLLKIIEDFKSDYPNLYKKIKYIFILCLILPIFTWLLYFIGDNWIVLISTSLTIDGLLSFYGAVLSSLGTIVLGALALWQNFDFKKRENFYRKQDLAISYSPLLLFDGDNEGVFYNGHPDENGHKKLAPKDFIPFNGKRLIWKRVCMEDKEQLQLKLKMKNVGSSIATNIVATAQINSENKCNVLDLDNKGILFISNNDSGKVLINLNIRGFEENKKEIIKVSYCNFFGLKLYQLIELELDAQEAIKIKTMPTVEYEEEPQND